MKVSGKNCANCNHLRTQIERVGNRPVCLKKKHTFGLRDFLDNDYKNDIGINTKSCERFEVFVPQNDKMQEDGNG